MAITAAAGGGSWSAGGTWVGGVPPTAADDVLLTVTSGAITIDGTSGTPNLCRSLDCTGYTGTLTQASAKVLNIGDASGGALTIVSGMTYVPNIGSTINFVSTTGVNNITTAGKAMGALVFNGVGGSWQFQDGYTNTTFGTSITLTNGSLDMNGKTFSLCQVVDSGTATRSLTLGAASITLQVNWTFTATGLTMSAASSTITFGVGGVTFQGAGQTYGTLTTGQATQTISDANTFATFSWSNLSGSAGTLTLGGNLTVTGTFTSNGSSLTQAIRNTIISNGRGTARTITAATVTCIYSNFRDITGAGAGNWDLHAITGLSGDCGGNSGITFTTPISCFMKTAVSVNWSASANWFTTSGGAIAARTPLPQDTAMFDANSVTAGSKTITIDMPHIAAMDWSNVGNTPALASGSTAIDVYGSVKFVAGMTHTGTGGWTLDGRGSFNFDGGGLTWPTSSNITMNAPGSTYTFTTAFTSNAAITETMGNITTQSTLSCTVLTVTAGTFTMGGNITLTGALSVTGTMTDGTGTTYSISGGTTLAVPAGGSLTVGTFSGTSSTNLVLGTASIGTLTLSGTYQMTSGSGSMTIGAGGMTCTTLTISTSGATFAGGAGLVNPSSTATLTGGTISFGAGGLTAPTCTISSSTTRSISLGSGTITLSSTGTVWNATTTTGLTFNAQTSTISITDTSATTKTFTGNTLTYNNISVSGAASNGTLTFSGAFTANTMTFAADASIIWTKTTTYTISGLVCNGSSGHNVTFATNTGGTAATLSCANPINVDWMSIKDSTASGNTPFYASTNSTNVSGNTNWTFTARPATGGPFPYFDNQFSGGMREMRVC